MSSVSVSILIPAYNEESTLRPLFDRTLAVLRELTDDFEIILCDDASMDSTKKIIGEIVAQYPQARAIFHQHNQGLFKTFDELYHSALKEYLLLLPGDGQWDPDFLKKAIPLVSSADVIIAQRRNKKYSLGRRINSWFFNRLTCWLYGVELYDIGSVKLMRREIVDRVVVSSQSAFTEAERLLKAYALGYRIRAVQVEHISRRQGKAGGATVDKILKAFAHMMTFRLVQWPRMPHSTDRVKRGKDIFNVMILLCISLLMCWPLFQGDLIITHDFNFGFVRAVGMHQSWLDGHLLGRWIPYLINGYGYSGFNYYSPLFSYIAAFLMFMMSPVWAFHMTVFLVIFLSGVAMYFFARQIWGEQGGVVAGAAYMLSPYHIVDLYVRGASAELTGFVFIPLIFLSFYRLSRQVNFKDMILAIGAAAGLILSHTLVSMCFFSFAFFYAILEVVRGQTQWRQKFAVFGFIGLASLLLTMYFWLPLVMEGGYIHRQFLGQGHYDYNNNFINIKQLFAPSAADQDGMMFILGAIHMTGALMVAVFIRRISRTVQGAGAQIIFFAMMLLIGIFLTLSLSKPIWQFIHPLWLFEFPWRFLMCPMFAASFLLGGILFILPEHRRAGCVFFIFILLISFNISYCYQSKRQPVIVTDYRSFLKASLPGDNGFLLPRWVSQIRLEAPSSKLQVWSGDAFIGDDKSTNALKSSFHVTADKPSLLCYYGYYFPGWEIYVDDKRQEIFPDNPFGLMAFMVEPGEHEIRVVWGTTPLRRFAESVSLGMLALFFLWIIMHRSGARPFKFL